MDESFEYDREAYDEAFGDDDDRPRTGLLDSGSGLWQRIKQRVGLSTEAAPQVHRVAGSSMVTAMLPNGKQTQMRITPAPASARAINRLRAEVAAGDRRMARALANDARAIRQLGAAQATALKKLTAQQIAADTARTKRLVDSDAKLDKRISKAIAKARGGTKKDRRRASGRFKRMQRRALWNNILLATGAPFFAAFGDRQNPFSRDNLTLTASMAGWMLGDEILDSFVRGRDRDAKRRRQAMGRGADLWSYLAPVGNAATAWFLLKDRQQERFLTGLSPVSFAAGDTIVPLDDIATKYVDDFAKRTNVRAVATIVVGPSGATDVTAHVLDGKLHLRLLGSGSGIAAVAWMVDTQDPDA